MKQGLVFQGIKVVGLALLLSLSSASQGDERLYVFGDSLSDIGNNLLLTRKLEGAGVLPFEVPPQSRYYEGRFSNGPVWVDYLADSLGIKRKKLLPSRLVHLRRHSLVYAHGGSGTTVGNLTPGGFPVDGLLGQVASFVDDSRNPAAQDAYYMIWSGANDYLLGGLVDGIPPLPDPPDNPTAPSVANIVSAIEALNRAGARHFFVFNLPNLGNIPAAAALGEAAQASLLAVTQAHNATLAAALQMLVQSGTLAPDSTLELVDTFSLFAAIGDKPQAFGFSAGFTDPGPATGCLVFLELGPDCSPLPGGLDAAGYPVWDEQHPSSKLHRLVAFRVWFCIDDPGSCTVR